MLNVNLKRTGTVGLVLVGGWLAVAASGTAAETPGHQVGTCDLVAEFCPTDENGTADVAARPKLPPGWKQRCFKKETKRHCKRRIKKEDAQPAPDSADQPTSLDP